MCVCVCVRWETRKGRSGGWVGGQMLKVSVDDLHAPSSWLLGHKNLHGRFLQPAWPQSPLYTRSLCCVPTLWSSSSSEPSLFTTYITHTHTHLENKEKSPPNRRGFSHKLTFRINAHRHTQTEQALNPAPPPPQTKTQSGICYVHFV